MPATTNLRLPLGYRQRSGNRAVTIKRTHWEVGEPGGRGIAIVFGDDESNADLFVRAVNSHAALLEACKAAVWAMAGKGYDPERYDQAQTLCESAIALAEER